jgi:hypothetical protein
VAPLAEHDGNGGCLEVFRGDEGSAGEDFVARGPFAFGHDELDLLLAGNAGESSGGSGGFNTGNGAECIERGVNARVDGFRPNPS